MEYQTEVKEKWGKTEAYAEYAKKNLSADDYKSSVCGLEKIFAEFAHNMKAGKTYDSEETAALVLKLKAYITEKFYTCDDKILASLGKMYVEDERFKTNIDKNGEGTAQYVHEAIEVIKCSL